MMIEAGSSAGNVHLHAIYFGPRIEQEELSCKWERFTGSRVSWIEEFRYGRDTSLRRITQYGLRSGKISPELKVDFFDATRRLRLVEKYGLFKEIKL
jgi:hypothetical protein